MTRKQLPGTQVQSVCAPRASALRSLLAVVSLMTLAACSHFGDARTPPADKNAPRAQLSIGYSLLYQEADGIPKFKWILTFKDKPEEMGQVTNELISYYQQLADTMRRLSKQYPAMRIDVMPMSDIEGEERKAIGADMARDFAPVVGTNGVDFERKVLLMFYESLNEQRHLVAVMVGMESDPGLKKFLETTRTQLDTHYARVGALLDRRYFTH